MSSTVKAAEHILNKTSPSAVNNKWFVFKFQSLFPMLDISCRLSLAVVFRSGKIHVAT